VLDQRIVQQISTRRLRIVKYRGSNHGTDEYPFLIDEGGLVVFPITSAGLDYPAPPGYVSSGIAELDEALNGHGFRRGSSILITGTAGTGKTSVAASVIAAACGRGERCLYFAMEESAAQLERNMRSIGLHLAKWRRQGLLQLQSSRPTLYGLETHLARAYKEINAFEPELIVFDPITNLGAVGSDSEVTSAITRLLDFLKANQITAVFTALTSNQTDAEHSEVAVSSWMDTWILLRTLETAGTRRRGLYIIKSRGMPHSDSIHEFRFTSRGIRLGTSAREPS
jgi:circadian clock protein KaiC